MYKPLLQSARDPKPSMVDNWENATTSLASAISHFCESSTVLESTSLCALADTTSKDLAASIDWALSLFRTTLDGQLIQARLALAKTRNRLAHASSISRLPHEILLDIFLKFVYNTCEENQFSPLTWMNFRIELIYQRVHTLLQVCASWRNAAIACGSLWTIIPIVDLGVGHARILSTDLSLQRAGHRNLYLAVFRAHFARSRLEALVPRLSQFTAINIWTNSVDGSEIREVIRLLIQDQGPRSLSKLSLKSKTAGLGDRTSSPFTRLEPRLINLIESLSVLRISNIDIAWQAVSFKFSHNLTELWMSSIVLDDAATIGFFSALCSASELQKLTIASIRASTVNAPILIPSTTPFPKLKSLYIEALPLSLLDLFLEFVGSGSYCLTLSPCDDIYEDFPSERNIEEDFCAVLKKRPVHTLILALGERSFWETGVGLHRILESAPSMKTLVLNFYDIDTSILNAFIPHFPRGPDYAFPNLEAIEIYVASFCCALDDLQTGFSSLLGHHPIQRMVLGGTRIKGATLPGVDNDAIKWLKARIPHFCMIEDPQGAPFIVGNRTWQLWDM